MSLKFFNISALTLLSTAFFICTAQSSVKAQSVRFFCGSKDGVPITYVNNVRGDLPVIRWNSNYFSGSGYTPERRCSEVSSRFQSYYEDGILNYITTGRMNRQTVICVSLQEGTPCHELLLTLRPNDNATQVVQQLFDVRARAGGPLDQSGGRVYLDFDEFLDTREAEVSDQSTYPLW